MVVVVKGKSASILLFFSENHFVKCLKRFLQPLDRTFSCLKTDFTSCRICEYLCPLSGCVKRWTYIYKIISINRNF